MLRIDSNPENRRVFLNLGNLEDKSRKGVRRFMFVFGDKLLRSFNRAVLKKPRNGRVYIYKDRSNRSNRNRRHIASQAGESPANRSGEYRRSAGYQLRGTGELLFGAEASYAGFLEAGTSRMRARPGLGNAVRELEGESLSLASESLEQAILKR